MTVNKANKVPGSIKRSVGTANVNVFSMLYKSLVRPILEYAAPVWCPYLAKVREDQGVREVIPHIGPIPIIIPLKLFLEGIDFLTDNITSRVAWKLRGGGKVQNMLGLAGECEMRVSSQRISQLYT